MRVILDTNVFLRAMLSRQSPVHTILAAWGESRFELLSSTVQLGEIDDVARRPVIRRFFHTSVEPDELIRRLWDAALGIDLRRPYPDLKRDPKDSYLLAMVRDGAADIMVTEDKDLLALDKFASAKIMRVHEFLSLLEVAGSH